MKFQSLKYGLIAGILAGLMMTIAFYAGFNTRNNRYLTLGVLIFIYLGTLFTIRDARKFYGGEINFKNALMISLLSGLIIATIYTGFTYLYYTTFNPNFAQKYLVDIEISIKQTGKSGLALQKDMDEWRQELTANNLTSKMLTSNIVMNTILALINSVILCKKD